MGGGRLTAREFFEGARAAQRSIDRMQAAMAAMVAREGVRAQRYDLAGKGAARNPNDPTPTDTRIDYERRYGSEIAELRAQVEDAERVARGVNDANPATLPGDALILRYCCDMGWQSVALAMGVSPRTAQRLTDAALDWVDAVGVARAREGLGQAQPL